MQLYIKPISKSELEARVEKATKFVYRSRKIRYSMFMNFSGMDMLDMLLVWWADKHNTLMHQGSLADRLENKWLAHMQKIDPRAVYSKKYCQYQMVKLGVLFLNKARHDLEDMPKYSNTLLNVSNCSIYASDYGLAIENDTPIISKHSLFLNKDGSLSSERGTTCSTVCMFTNAGQDDYIKEEDKPALRAFVEWNRKVYSKSLMTYAMDYTEYLDHCTIYGLEQHGKDLKKFLSLYTDDNTIDTVFGLYNNDADKIVSTIIAGTQTVQSVELPTIDF